MVADVDFLEYLIIFDWIVNRHGKFQWILYTLKLMGVIKRLFQSALLNSLRERQQLTGCC